MPACTYTFDDFDYVNGQTQTSSFRLTNLLELTPKWSCESWQSSNSN